MKAFEPFSLYPPPVIERAPIRLLVVDTEMRGALLVADVLQASPVGARAQVYVAMSRQPGAMRFIGRTVDAVLKEYESMVLSVFDWYHILLLGECTPDPTGSHLVVEPVLPAAEMVRVLRGESYWKRMHDELLRRYETDIQKAREESMNTVEALRRVVHRVWASQPKLVDAIEYVLGASEAAVDAEALSRIMMEEEQMIRHVRPREQEVRRSLIERLRSMVRRERAGMAGT